MINPTFRTLKRRGVELRGAANNCEDEDSAALLLFYSAECLLKALYISTFSLKDADHSTASTVSARSYSHQLDRIMKALRIRPVDVPPRPSSMQLRNGNKLEVGDFHQAWRYGEKVDGHHDVVQWLQNIITYVENRL